MRRPSQMVASGSSGLRPYTISACFRFSSSVFRASAGHFEDPTRTHTFRLFADGHGEGKGPSGVTHARFRTWKEDLRDHP